MGLNVYFCDVCGVRVTDVDLRSGHGMLRGHDVICATCLEMGHGKEWLASRGVPAEAAANGNGSGPRPASNAALLDHARDRVATVGDLDESAPTSIDHEDTHSVPVQRQADFASAAAGFAALRSSEPVASDDADGALDEESSDHVDPVLLKQPADSSETSEELRAPIDESDDESSALIRAKEPAPIAGGKAKSLRRSVSGARPSSPPAKAASAKAPTKRSSASSVQASKSGSSSSSGSSGKIAKAKSSSTRSGRKPSGGGGMPLPIKISLFTIPVILILAIVLVGPKVVGSAPKTDVKDMPAQKSQVERSYKDTTSAINAAVGSKDLAVLKAAQASWYKLNEDFEVFERNAKTYSKWTEDDCSNYRESLKFQDLGSRMKLIRDEIAKQSVGH